MNKPQLLLKVSALSLALFSAMPKASEQPSTTAVHLAYAEYRALSKEGTEAERLVAAKKAYDISKSVNGDLHIDTIVLGQNYAKHIPFDDKRDAIALYEKLLADLTKVKGEDAVEKVDIHLNLAKLYRLNGKNNELKNNLQAAVVLSKNSLITGLDAQTYYDAAEILAPTKYRNLMQEYLDTADEITKSKLPKDSLLSYKIALFKAQVHAFKKDYSDAINILEEKVASIDSITDFDSAIEQQMRIKLIDWYEETGQSEKSTKQCQALGQLVPWSNEQEQVPLFRVHPNLNNVLPSIRELKDTVVIAKFDVTPEGSVDNIKIESVDGNRELAKVTKDTIKKWRYAPKFEDGKPVTATTQVQMDYKFDR